VWLFEPSLPTFETIFSSLHYDVNRILSMIAANQAEADRATRGMVNVEAQEYQRRSQMINEFGQNMQGDADPTLRNFSDWQLGAWRRRDRYAGGEAMEDRREWH
jgi:hypothetical protein